MRTENVRERHRYDLNCMYLLTYACENFFRFGLSIAAWFDTQIDYADS